MPVWAPAALAGTDDVRADCTAQAVLARLQAEVTGPLEEAQLERARSILETYCGEAVTVAEAAAIEAVEEEVLEVFGIEIRRADPDSRGHDRLTRKR